MPWLSDETGTYLGIDQPDGRLTLAVSAVGLILAWHQIRIGWMAAGFSAAVLIRHLTVLAGSDSAVAEYGLWVGAVAFSIAAALQVARLIRNIRSGVGDNP